MKENTRSHSPEISGSSGTDQPLRMEREVTIVLGKSGQGKTTWVQQQIEQLDRVLVWDPKKQYRNIEFRPDLPDLINREKRPETFRYGTVFPEHAEDIGDAGMLAGNCTIVLEECTVCLDKKNILPDWIRDPLFLGRERGVSIIAVSQRPASIPIFLRSQASRIVTFNQTEDDDVLWLKKLFGQDMLNLNILECLDWTLSPPGPVKRYSIAPPPIVKKDEISVLAVLGLDKDS